MGTRFLKSLSRHDGHSGHEVGSREIATSKETVQSSTSELLLPTCKRRGYVLEPQAFILGWTREDIQLPVNSRLAARVEGKSSLARIGLGVHITAPTIHAGFKGPIQLEICNHGSLRVRLRPKMRVCQLILEQTLGNPVKGYKGQFYGQTAR
jgi:deoxycytidine triphosphate deaminase